MDGTFKPKRISASYSGFPTSRKTCDSCMSEIGLGHALVLRNLRYGDAGWTGVGTLHTTGIHRGYYVVVCDVLTGLHGRVRVCGSGNR
jgi:hypothetical protein